MYMYLQYSVRICSILHSSLHAHLQSKFVISLIIQASFICDAYIHVNIGIREYGHPDAHIHVNIGITYEGCLFSQRHAYIYKKYRHPGSHIHVNIGIRVPIFT